MQKGTKRWVRRLYELGFTPIPISEQSKAPNGFESGELKFYHYNRPSKDVVEKWIEEDLYDNIGVMLGKVHGNLVCFDFDNPQAFKLLRLDPNHLIEEGEWVTSTPNEEGRYHIFVRHKDAIDLHRESSHSVELRANEHYVLFYPSIHPNGKQYDLLNTHNPEDLKKPREADVKQLWDAWKREFRDAFDEPDVLKNNVKTRKEFDRSPDCIRNAWEQGANVGQRQHTIIGLSNWMRENSFPQTMTEDVILNWFRKKCKTKNKPTSKVIEAVEAGYNDKYNYGCRFWRKNTDFCPFKEKRNCKFFQPDKKTKDGLLAEYDVLKRNDEGVVTKIRAPNLAKMLIKEYNFNFTTIIDKSSSSQEDIYYYEDGYYKSNGKSKIRQLVNYFLDSHTSEYYKREVIGCVSDHKKLDRDNLNPPVNLINMKNGVYDIEKKKLLPHSKDYYFINQIPIEYNQNAECPKIKEFFEDVLYPEHEDLMQEIFGYILYRKYFLHVAFLFVGGGRNGKGVTVNLMRELVGKENFSTKSLHSLASQRFSTIELYGKMVNIGAEVADRELEHTSTFKNITGGEPLDAEKKHGASFSFKNYAKLVFNANRVPYSRDHSFAFQQRWIIVPFPRTFPRGDPETDPKLEQKLTEKKEMQGLFNWAIKGLERLLENYDFSYEERHDYEDMKDPEKKFILNKLTTGMESTISAIYVYEKYRDWCHKNRFQIVTKKTFFKKLKYYIPEARKKQKMSNGNRIYVFENLNLKDESERIDEDQEPLEGDYSALK